MPKRRESRWARRCLSAATAILLPVTVLVLSDFYGLNIAVAGVLGTAQTVPLLISIERPLPAWLIVFAADIVGGVAMMVGMGFGVPKPWPWTPMAIIGYLVVMLALGLRERRRTLLGVWLATGVAGASFTRITPGRTDATALLLFVLSGVFLVLGSALRERGDARRRLKEQETISEAERARRTQLEERTRIARELHDVVAHHMSVITVQAESAPLRIGGMPEQAREEFTTIAATARESLAEMRRLLGVLRAEETERPGGPEKAPQPGLSQLPKLVEATVRAGVPVELALPAEPPALPQAVELSAYRIVQEALANVVRHAPGARTRVSVSVDRTHLRALVVNGAARAAGPPLEAGGTGHGLVGMRERVRLLDGALDAGPLPDGGFRVAAHLPIAAKDSDRS